MEALTTCIHLMSYSMDWYRCCLCILHHLLNYRSTASMLTEWIGQIIFTSELMKSRRSRAHCPPNWRSFILQKLTDDSYRQLMPEKGFWKYNELLPRRRGLSIEQQGSYGQLNARHLKVRSRADKVPSLTSESFELCWNRVVLLKAESAKLQLAFLRGVGFYKAFLHDVHYTHFRTYCFASYHVRSWRLSNTFIRTCGWSKTLKCNAFYYPWSSN